MRVWTTQPKRRFVSGRGYGLGHAWTTFGLGGDGPGAIAVHDAGPLRANGLFGTGSPSTATGNTNHLTPYGYAVHFDDSGTGTSASKRIDVGNSSGSGAPRGSVFSFIAFVSFGATGTQYIYSTNSANGGARWQLNASTQLNLVKPGTADMGSGSTSLSANKFYVVGTTYDGSTIRFYVNGNADGTSSNTQTFTHGQASIGDQTAPGYLSNGSDLMALLQFDVALSAVEMRAYSDNIWRIFQRREPLYVNTVGAPAVSARPLFIVPSNLSGVGTGGPFFQDRL